MAAAAKNGFSFSKEQWERMDAPESDAASRAKLVAELVVAQLTSPRPAEAAAAEPAVVLDEKAVLKIHSAFRWGKPLSEIQAVCKEWGVGMQDAIRSTDPGNGNYALHIAAQNGHEALVEALIGLGATVNAQNGKGQTPLHMSVEYDMYWLSKRLREVGAKDDVKNDDGHEAIKGIDGGKVGGDSWDAPSNILKASATPARVRTALEALETMDAATRAKCDKAALIQVGMAKKKSMKEGWDHARFMAIAKSLP